MKLILNGGGDGKAVESARQALNSAIDPRKKMLYIPFAWPDPAYRGCLEFMTGELADVDKAGIEMVKTPRELMDRVFTDYACLYIGGGNTWKLLQDLKTCGAFGRIRHYLEKEDGIVYGGSAARTMKTKSAWRIIRVSTCSAAGPCCAIIPTGIRNARNGAGVISWNCLKQNRSMPSRRRIRSWRRTAGSGLSEAGLIMNSAGERLRKGNRTGYPRPEGSKPGFSGKTGINAQ